MSPAPPSSPPLVDPASCAGCPHPGRPCTDGRCCGVPHGPWPRLRVGDSWYGHGGLTTVVSEGTGPAGPDGRRPDDTLLGVMATPGWAALVARSVNTYLDGHARRGW